MACSSLVGAPETIRQTDPRADPKGNLVKTGREIFLDSSALDLASWHAHELAKRRVSISRWLAETLTACGVFEWITFTYLGWLLAIFVVRHRNIAHPHLLFALHVALGIVILTLARAAARSDNVALELARHWYPLPLYLWLFEELGGIVHAIFPVWFDRFFIEFDYNLAGVHPSVWLARYATLALNDFMQFA